VRATWTAAIAAVVLLAGCLDLSTDPNEIVAIEMSRPAWPSVVIGDTLRDADGVVAPLAAQLFQASGDLVTGTPIAFLTADTAAVQISTDGVVTGKAAAASVRIFASGAGLQSIPDTLAVVPAPDTIFRQGTTAPIQYLFPDEPTTNISADVTFKVQSTPAGATAVGVAKWIVQFRLLYRGVIIDPTDSATVFLTNGVRVRPSYVDTTDAQGLVTRKIRFRAGTGNVPQEDSLTVLAWARYRGGLVKGDTVRAVVQVKPKL
jgi:hypothetical protein